MEAHPEAMLAVDKARSFMQNIADFARAQHIAMATVSGITGVEENALKSSYLEHSPYPLHGRMSKAQAEKAIRLIVPERLRDEFRHLKGYPEPTIDEAMGLLIKQSKDPELKTLRGKKFGALFRLNREQKPRNGEFLRLKDCAVLHPYEAFSLSASELSATERGERTVNQTQGFSLLGKLGYDESTQGLEDFCRETVHLQKAYAERKEKFGRALFVHLYPSGEIPEGSRGTRLTDITQQNIVDRLSCSTGRIGKIFRGEDVPTTPEILQVIDIFGYSGKDAEKRFYDAAKIAIAEVGVLKIPPAKIPPPTMIQLGSMAKIVRQELGVTQIAFDAFIHNIKPDASVVHKHNNSFATRLESGKLKRPIASTKEANIFHSLNLNSIEELRSLSENIALIQNFRKEHFAQSLHMLAERDNEAAIEILRRKQSNNHFTPTEIRDDLATLELTEIALYRKAKITVPAQVREAYSKVSEFIEDFEHGDLAKFAKDFSSPGRKHVDNARVGKRPSSQKSDWYRV